VSLNEGIVSSRDLYRIVVLGKASLLRSSLPLFRESIQAGQLVENHDCVEWCGIGIGMAQPF